ncbi:hypothetical protein ACIBCN_04050 [Nocardia sp. NPDC051052]|uniref:hypothetical protein n=1 Tax=Nocardia sp. NPDC051052 TaxID=3364322 RepID=UPI0037B4C8E1
MRVLRALGTGSLVGISILICPTPAQAAPLSLETPAPLSSEPVAGGWCDLNPLIGAWCLIASQSA